MKPKPAPSLLEQAKGIKVNGLRNYVFDEQDMELIEGYLDGQVTLGQVAKVKHLRGGGVSAYIYITLGARALWQRIRAGSKVGTP